MTIFLVVFDGKSTHLTATAFPELEAYSDQNYVCLQQEREYGAETSLLECYLEEDSIECDSSPRMCAALPITFEEKHEYKLNERLKHKTDTFSQYLLYLIQEKGMTNAEVYKRAVIDKKVFSKIKNNMQYHPQKITALCLCMGAQLNLDQSKDLLEYSAPCSFN